MRKWKTTRDTTSFSLHVNSKPNKIRDVTFIIDISKNVDHIPPPNWPPPFYYQASLQRYFSNFPPFHKIV